MWEIVLGMINNVVLNAFCSLKKSLINLHDLLTLYQRILNFSDFEDKMEKDKMLVTSILNFSSVDLLNKEKVPKAVL